MATNNNQQDNKQSNILVAVRIRPRSQQEVESNAEEKVRATSNVVVVDDPAAESDDILKRRRSKPRKFAFDQVLGGECEQQEVYEKTTKNLVPTALDGFNSTVFAYGATGSGKTYTVGFPCIGSACTYYLCIDNSIYDVFRCLELKVTQVSW